MFGRSTTLVALSSLALVVDLRAQCEPVLRSGDELDQQLPRHFGRFGWSMDTDGARVLVGAPGYGSSRGVAMLFGRGASGWVRERVILHEDQVGGDRFADSVGIDGDTVVGGAPGDDGGGAAYVFDRGHGNWAQAQRLVGSDTGPGDEFGSGVDLDGDVLVVGAWRKDGASGVRQGAAYVFRRRAGGWVEEQKLVPSSPVGEDLFGTDVAVDGDTLVVGAEGRFDGGAATAYRRDGATWVEDGRLEVPGRPALGWFGRSVDLEGEVALVGAPSDDLNGHLSGSAHVFRRGAGGWFNEDELEAPRVGINHAFGAGVDLDGDFAVVGAAYGGSAEPGRSFTFRRTPTGEWVCEHELRTEVPEDGDSLGYSVAAIGDEVFSGAPFSDVGAENAGKVTVHQAPELRLDIDPPVANPGETVLLQLGPGDVGRLGLLFVLSIDGVTVNLKLAQAPFPVDCSFEIGGDVPANLSGLDVLFIGFGWSKARHFVASNLAPFSVR